MKREYGQDYTEEAIALFTRFVGRHGFTHEVEIGAPVEVMWNIPAQPGLSLPIILGLQNYDELNFGVADFWSYFFPFNRVYERFERYLDLWVSSDARVAETGPVGRVLQIREGKRWKSVYAANRMLPVWRKPRALVLNDPTYSNSTMT